MNKHNLILKNKREFEITDEQKQKILPAWSRFTSERKDTILQIGSIPEFTASQISFIDRASSTNKKSKSNDFILQMEREYFIQRDNFLKLKPEEKVTHRKSFLNFMWMSLTGDLIHENDLGEVKTITYNFYKENPTRLYPNPTLYKHLLKDRNIAFGVNVLTAVLNTDMSYSKKYKLIYTPVENGVHGIVVANKDHAEYLYNIDVDFAFEGNFMDYRDDKCDK